MKIYSLYLPQFHETEENNKWWGKGFTEWTNVKKAKPLFPGHQQPKVPLNNNYYDLLNKESVVWQTKLMNKYGIDGFIYYHYYFKGKLLLEKPAENLLKWTDIQQPFFFCWANHSWNRSWEGKRTILMDMDYGNKDDWKKHFDYLLPFFKDERYQKVDNRPLFMIYDSNGPLISEITKYFDSLCKKEGFDGIKVINELFEYPSSEINSLNYNYISQPSASRISITNNKNFFEKLKNKIIRKITQKGYFKKVELLEGDYLYSDMLEHSQIFKNKNNIPGIFFEWDNTPRHGYRGSIIKSVSKSCFLNYMDSIADSEFVIVNAWNEWAEGMILEPTEEKSYQYLEWIRDWKDRNNN
ncbi:polysaccharide biosynthesis protein [Erysipelotrichaceae bacterium NYU-BL-E8]|uniref:Polysaccharide biosynthesis protein n=2 Tax=Ileibacterium valens TaxID=1862668 RepID=A0A1U7NF12_9FIRM|nr:polysaccharide biosynthesis protein [Erysipelotrichaceae bacterium NYU-BL-F16]OLU38515.1 polysaccharide biosynthesis protein [Ileibacterium valens]OLU38829.1 polysaccharide biosynthesis protein [Erysipelotrichaceae bacterium NYU-BL-E8]